MKKQGHVLVAAVIGVFAALSLALTTDQILHRVYDAANTALRVNVVAGGGGGGGGAPSGAAGGDLGGTYPNPTLKDCAANEILQRNAGDTAWECAALAGGGGLTSGTTAITDGLDTAICYDAAGVIKCDATSPTFTVATGLVGAGGFHTTGGGTDVTDAPFATPDFFIITNSAAFYINDPTENNLLSFAYFPSSTGLSVIGPNGSIGMTTVNAAGDGTDLLNLPYTTYLYGGSSETYIGANASLHFFAGGVAAANEYWKIDGTTGALVGTQAAGNTINVKTAAPGDNGYNLLLYAGEGSSTGAGGDITLNAGNAGVGSGLNGGSVNINPGVGDGAGFAGSVGINGWSFGDNVGIRNLSDNDAGLSVTATRFLASPGTPPAVSDTSAASCGTTAATLVGTDAVGKVTVGATAGTSCTITFASAWPNAPSCVVNNETTANLARATSTTTTTILAGTFVAGDVLAYSCGGYAT